MLLQNSNFKIVRYNDHYLDNDHSLFISRFFFKNTHARIFIVIFPTLFYTNTYN